MFNQPLKVIFIPGSGEGNPYQKLLSDSLSKENVHVSFGLDLRLFLTSRSCKKYWKPKVIHFHWLHPLIIAPSNAWKTILKSVTFIGELLILKLFGIKMVWTVHNIVNHEKKFSFLESFFTKLFAIFCNEIIVHSQFAKKEVIKIYKIKESLITVVPHGNYIDYYKNTISREQARQQLTLNKKDVVFLLFGQIRSYKGVPELINAFKNLKSQQTKLLIIGKPRNNKMISDIQNECKKNKNIKAVLEFILKDEVQVYMNASDIIILPYRNVLTSGAAILTMSFAKPIIAPAIGCMPELLGKNGGILYNPTEKDGLIKAMRRALKINFKKMGKYNFEFAKQLPWHKIAKKTCNVYQQCLKTKN